MRLGRSSRWMGTVALVAVLTSGCTESGDIGYPCVLVRSDGDGGVTPILNGELQPNTDIVSFGSFECEDFVCVRHRYAEVDESNPSAPAAGVCSRPCTSGDPRGCAAIHPAASEADGQFTCRSLVLDEETLAALCSIPDPPPICGSTDQSNYCAQGATRPGAKGPDAGT